jgi:hypothetical protein
MHDIQILKQNPKQVLDALKLGEIERIELSVEQITDEFMIYGLRGGLIDELSNSFPDPRKECEITTKQILSASIAGHFQDMYAISQSPYALHSPTLLAELGLNVKVLLEGEGISRKGTKDNSPFNGDVIRKMTYDMTLTELLHWYNCYVGKAYLKQSNYQPSIHILDCTELEVNIENENYEGSGIVKEKKKDANGKVVEKLKRGYKLGSLRSLLDDGGIITGIAFGAIQVHDHTLCKELLMKTPHLKSGDMLIEDRGFLDGETITKLKKKRGVDVTIPLRSDMLAYEDCLATAYHPDSGKWEKHPTREKQEIKRIEYADYMWDKCSVPLVGCVVRELKKGKDGSVGRGGYEHWVFVTTRLSLSGKQIIQTYELRPEIEEDHRQWKDGPWDMSKFTSTSMVQIFYHIINVLLSYNLMKLYFNTQSGQRFSQKTLRQMRREQLRNHEVAMVVYTYDSYAVFTANYLIWLLLGLPKGVQERLKPHFDKGFP